MEIKEYASLKKIQDQLLIDQGRKPGVFQKHECVFCGRG